MILEKVYTEVIDHFLDGIKKNGRMDKIKELLIEPTLFHVSKYFNKYIMYFYTILILLIVFIAVLITIMIRLITKLNQINEVVLTHIAKPLVVV
jgi:hypothetical protein